ncbi:MAG: RNA polymerase sigma factor [Clostridia bacterium]|nr:RNA polymerase sigma factor [Clostridia bacterium]
MLNILMTLQEEFDVKRPIDDDLLKKIAQGDMDAFHTLYESVSASVYGLALSITKNSHDADDVLQETFLKVHANASAYRPQGKPLAWILTITRNLAMTKLREQSRTQEIQETHAVDYSSIRNAEQKLLIETLLNHLSEEERQIVMLHAISGLKHREIAKILEAPLNTVLSKYHRAIKKLQLLTEEV